MSFVPSAAANKPEPQHVTVQNAATAPQALDDEEVAELAKRAEDPGREVAGGALTNQQLTYIVIALATAVIILLVK